MSNIHDVTTQPGFITPMRPPGQGSVSRGTSNGRDVIIKNPDQLDKEIKQIVNKSQTLAKQSTDLNSKTEALRSGKHQISILKREVEVSFLKTFDNRDLSTLTPQENKLFEDLAKHIQMMVKIETVFDHQLRNLQKPQVAPKQAPPQTNTPKTIAEEKPQTQQTRSAAKSSTLPKSMQTSVIKPREAAKSAPPPKIQSKEVEGKSKPQEPVTPEIEREFKLKKLNFTNATFQSFRDAIAQAAEKKEKLYCVDNNIISSSSKPSEHAIEIPTNVICKIAVGVSAKGKLPKDLVKNLNILNNNKDFQKIDIKKADIAAKELDKQITNSSLKRGAPQQIEYGKNRNTIACKCLDSIAKLMKNQELGPTVTKTMDCDLAKHMKPLVGQHTRRANLELLAKSPPADGDYVKYMRDVSTAGNTAAAADHITRCLEKLNEGLKTKLGTEYEKDPVYQEFKKIKNTISELAGAEKTPTDSDVDAIGPALSKLTAFVTKNIDLFR